ncbi:ABC transporter permease [Paucisalibacillus sp. EB02]|uniref:ABC transporter permease n=1 Tax=Paucisalibacillus sp. EB02 TaxID=1347087 RepID=UPI0004BC18CC|nr:ABC transporter permease [Paucisalibacillus sp. EB02]
MHFLKLLSLFTKNNFLQLRRKWRSLPLLLLFPFLFIGLVSFIFVNYITSLDEKPLHIGLVDLDQSTETEMVLKLLAESSQLGDFLHMEQVSEDEAKKKIAQDELIAYILFPESFTKKLYNGESVIVSVIGHPNRQMESYFIKELVDSATRHISSSQANILTINYFAKQLDMDSETRNQIVLEQFNEFLLYAIGKDNVLDQQVLSNKVTTSPKEYFGLAAGFFILTIWVLSVYQLLFKEQSKEIQTRMMLYGVTELQQMIARVIVTFFLTTFLGILLFIGIIHLLQLDIPLENYARMFVLISIFNLTFLFVLTIIESIIDSKKIRLFLQIGLTAVLMLSSGSFIPDIYLPLYMQDYLQFVFSNQIFFWLEEILLNERIYVDYTPLLLSIIVGAFATVGISTLRERVKS